MKALFYKFWGLSPMQKIAFLGSIASIVGLAITFVSTSGNSEGQITYGNQSQAIGNVEGDVKNYYPSKTESRPKSEDRLPKGFTVDEDGFVRNKSGKRICEEREIVNPPRYYGGTILTQRDWETRCQLWNGSWKKVSDGILIEK